MIKIATSIVGKLWGTILLLVSFVLFIFTMFMLEFLENYHYEQSEVSLRQTAAAIASIMDEEELDDKQFAIISELLTETTNVLIAKNSNEVLYSMQEGINKEEIQQKITSSRAFEEVYESKDPIVKKLMLPSNIDENKTTSYIVLGFPLKSEEAQHGAVFIYKNPDALSQTSKETTKIVFLAAAIAFVLTTIFAFFLSSKITLPLRKMREHAFELAKGRFDSNIETKQNDEIGQLALAFNQMGRQLKHHLEVINQEKEQLSSI